MKQSIIIVISVLICAVSGELSAQTYKPGILLDSIVAVRQAQFDAVSDMTLDAVLVERRLESDGRIKETKQYGKKIYAKKFVDNLLIREDYLEYFKDGEKQSAKDLAKEAKKKQEEKEKGRRRDITYDVCKPLQTEYRPLYEIEYDGLTDTTIDDFICHKFRAAAHEEVDSLVNCVFYVDTTIDDFICHKFRATAHEEVDSLVNCVFYVDTASLQIVRVDFAPAKLASGLMFKLKKLDMTMHYQPYSDQIWVPRKFELRGKGKAALFVKVNFHTEEIYSNPAVNSGLHDSLFIETAIR